MKTPEDEAFDDLAKRQGAWGGGYQAKREAALDKLVQEQERLGLYDPPQPALAVADRLERLLWEYIDLQAAHPEHKPNPKTWPHLMTYSPLPVQRKPLTDEEIDAISLRDGGVTYRQLARAIEAAHGIKEKNNGT